MTTIIVLGHNIELTGVYDATNDLVNYHVHLLQARVQADLEQFAAEPRPVRLANLTHPYPFNDYRGIIGNLNRREAWSIYDDRVTYFAAELAELAGDTRLLWFDLESKTDYQRQMKRHYRAAFDIFTGPKLRLETVDAKAANRFAQGQDVPPKQTQDVPPESGDGRKRKAKESGNGGD